MGSLTAALCLLLVATYTTCNPMYWPQHLSTIKGSQESAESNEAKSSEEDVAVRVETPPPDLLPTVASESVETTEVLSKGLDVDPHANNTQTVLPPVPTATLVPVISVQPTGTVPPIGTLAPSATIALTAGPPDLQTAVTLERNLTLLLTTQRPESRGDDV